ncbi:hypothetical protein COO60DRAFT_239520 [Scenedesmus sp. NREL 46B-D3]|nr:hypothetical protein COO60DRAFT_239520 [Scenedesmus sp. NREL 46B-D3]
MLLGAVRLALLSAVWSSSGLGCCCPATRVMHALLVQAVVVMEACSTPQEWVCTIRPCMAPWLWLFSHDVHVQLLKRLLKLLGHGWRSASAVRCVRGSSSSSSSSSSTVHRVSCRHICWLCTSPHHCWRLGHTPRQPHREIRLTAACWAEWRGAACVGTLSHVPHTESITSPLPAVLTRSLASVPRNSKDEVAALLL